jgi:hypothetical protein
MSKLSVEHTITLIADVDLEGMEATQRQTLENMSEAAREAFFTLLTSSVIKEQLLPKINENGSFAFLRVK